MKDREALLVSFLNQQGWADAARHHLAGDASNRRYERLRKPDGTVAVLMDAPPSKGEDTRPFIDIANYLRAQGLSTPAIYAKDPENGFLVIEDLGDDLFARLMLDDPARQSDLYRSAVDVLLHLRNTDVIPTLYSMANSLSEMTLLAFEWYAPDNDPTQFLAVFEGQLNGLNATSEVIVLRDYHAENLLWLEGREGVAQVGLLDFQDAVLGHPAYDLVSVLQDARRDVPPAIEEDMVAYYITQSGSDACEFRRAYALLGVQRNLRILGIFARLCLRDGKANYLDFIPRVWGYLQRNLATSGLENLATELAPLLPHPTPQFLEHLKSQCATHPPQP
jgi:aminoglycoside/choline kinase family phosphotransferase